MNELTVTEVIFKHDSRVPVVKLGANPCRFAAKVENRKHLRFVSCFPVVDAERKLLRKHPMKTKVETMNTAERRQPLEVFDNAPEKVISNPPLDSIIEVTCGFDVFRRFLQDDDSLHDRGRPSRPLSSSRVRNFP